MKDISWQGPEGVGGTIDFDDCDHPMTLAAMEQIFPILNAHFDLKKCKERSKVIEKERYGDDL